MKKKCYVLMVSKTFPCYHPKAGQPTGFGLKIKHYCKIHTIRANYEFWAKRFKQIDAGNAYLSVREWQDVPYQSKQQEIFRYDNTHNIGIQKINGLDKALPEVIEMVAENDGLTTEDFLNWFGSNLKKEQVIIHFTSFRYKHGIRN